ncbi:unnamed protein product, partial [Brassica rapa]
MEIKSKQKLGRLYFSGKNSTLWPWRPGLESQQPQF